MRKNVMGIPAVRMLCHAASHRGRLQWLAGIQKSKIVPTRVLRLQPEIDSFCLSVIGNHNINIKNVISEDEKPFYNLKLVIMSLPITIYEQSKLYHDLIKIFILTYIQMS